MPAPAPPRAPESESESATAPAPESRYRRARQRVDVTRQMLAQRGKELEARSSTARAAVRAYEHDRAVGGEIMAGAIAFRLFVFILPLVLVLLVTLGFAADAISGGAADINEQAGIGGIAAESVSESTRVSSGGRWFALILGLIALYSTSRALARAARIAHALAWGDNVAPLKRTWRASLIVTGAALVALLITAVVSRLRAESALAGIVFALLAVFLYAAVWFGLSLLLPHGNADWKALIPGAALVAVGVEVLHVVTVFYISGRVSSASALYGPIGAAVAILFWAYLVGRMVVGSAVLNASLHRRSVNEAEQAALARESIGS
jgi:uncharacterized BrkB/YihY/UPF0761 family membrane protein